MENRLRLRFCKGDIAVIVIVVALAVVTALLFLPEKTADNAVVEIYRDGQLIERLSLYEDQQMLVHGDYTNEITICDGKVSVTGSDCPGEDCVHSGRIAAPGRSIVCLPNGVEVRVTGEKSNVDFVVR